MPSKKVLPLGIKMIAPLHGPIWRTPESIQYMIEKYMHWSTYSAEKKGVVIAFGPCTATLPIWHSN